MSNSGRHISEMGNMSKIFLADYDSYSIKHYSISLDYLRLITKAALLLYDVILVPAAFFWQSEEMINLTISMQELFEYDFISPVIRNHNITSDIYEYYNARNMENSILKKHYSLSNNTIKLNLETGVFSEITTSKDRDNARKLENMSHAAYSDINSVKELFEKNWEKDINDFTEPNSVGSLLNFYKMPPEISESLLSEIKKTFFSRASCICKSNEIIPHRSLKSKIENRISWLYLKSVAEAYASKIYAYNYPYKGAIQEDNIPVMIDALSAIGISRELIASLSFRDILFIKGSPEYHNFIKTFRKIVVEISKKQQAIDKSLKSAVYQSLSKEKIRSRLTCMKKINNLSTSVFLGLIVNAFSGSAPDISQSAFISSGCVSALSFLLERISRINDTPLLDMQHYIISQKYEEQMLNYLER